MKRVLFVCTGNTCRSPMAEGFFRLLAEESGLDVEVRSAGVSAVEGMQISTNAAAILRDKGAIPAVTSRELSAELTEWSDLILTMTTSHKKEVIQQFPDAVDKTFTLKEFAWNDAITRAKLEAREQLISDLQIKQALQQPITAAEKKQLLELEKELPDMDILDPFGRHLAVYRDCAAEIESSVKRTIDRINGKL
ncbi:MAG: low molecular weight protein arginine phosphatase [Paenibacillaceae bacterium]